jgi:hypothetical protein
VIGQGKKTKMSVEIFNYGMNTENVNITIYANAWELPFSITIAEFSDIVLTSRNFAIIKFSWDTTGVPCGNYTLSAFATPVLGETDTTDNTYANGTVKVTILGDITGDFLVNIMDATQVGFYWQQNVPPAPANVNINDDGIINIKDASIVGLNWQKHA